MGYARKIPSYVSAADYLLLEERSLEKREYLDGVVYEWQTHGPDGMVGSSKSHNCTTLNIYAALRSKLQGSPCEAFVSEIKAAPVDDSAFFDPDLVVSCSEVDRGSELVIREPMLMVGVLSDSTELFDRRARFEAYRRFTGQEAYVLVSPEQYSIEVFTRAGEWARTPQTEAVRPMLDEVIELGTGGWLLAANEAFEGVKFGEKT